MTTSKLKRIILGLACLLGVSAYLWASPAHADIADVRAGTAPSQATSAVFLAPKKRRTTAAKFEHNGGGKAHAHARLTDCASCHNISVNDRDRDPNVKTYPGHKTCIECHEGKKIAHNFADETIKRFDAFCGICHSGMPISLGDKALFNFQEQTRIIRGTSASGSDFGMAFSHEAHYTETPVRKTIKLEMFDPPSNYRVDLNAEPRCNECHVRTRELAALPVSMQKGQEMLVEKGHSTCFQCHNTPDGVERKTLSGKKFPYMNDCAECHERLDGRQRQMMTELYNRVSEFRHADHEFDTRSILAQDRMEYRKREQQKDFLCIDCHQDVKKAINIGDIRYPREAKCDECHNTNLQPGLPDPLKADVKEKLRNAQR